MKFRITKNNFLLLDKKLKEEDVITIELEPVLDTATQAIYENHLKNEAFRKGIEYGYKEGFYDGRCPEKNSKYFFCSRCH